MEDAETGEVLAHFDFPNIITLDQGIAAARLFASPAATFPGNRMLAVGSGSLGAATSAQRSLVTEVARKVFSTVQYRDSLGNVSAIPTNVVDFTCSFGVGEAVGALDEMALLLPFVLSATPGNPIPAAQNPPNPYDPTYDVTGKDLLFNYATFGVITKPNGAVLTFTWRITF
jgi:hypothetical protein